VDGGRSFSRAKWTAGVTAALEGERRRSARSPAAEGASLQLPLIHDVDLVDISQGGVLIATNATLRIGQRALLRILLNREPLVASVEILRLEPDTLVGAESTHRRYGARFLAVDDRARRTINAFLRAGSGDSRR
jgi:hypothetical protein